MGRRPGRGSFWRLQLRTSCFARAWAPSACSPGSRRLAPRRTSSRACASTGSSRRGFAPLVGGGLIAAELVLGALLVSGLAPVSRRRRRDRALRRLRRGARRQPRPLEPRAVPLLRRLGRRDDLAARARARARARPASPSPCSSSRSATRRGSPVTSLTARLADGRRLRDRHPALGPLPARVVVPPRRGDLLPDADAPRQLQAPAAARPALARGERR